MHENEINTLMVKCGSCKQYAEIYFSAFTRFDFCTGCGGNDVKFITGSEWFKVKEFWRKSKERFSGIYDEATTNKSGISKKIVASLPYNKS